MTRTPPTIENGTVPPRRVPYAAHRTREHLTPSEIEHLIEVARKRGRYGHRDATMILLAYRHGLRVSELVALRWDQVDLKQGLLQVNRLKRGTPSTHPLRGPELRSLRQLERDFPLSSYVFQTERGGPMTAAGFRKMLERTGQLQTSPSPSTRTCSGTPAATSSPTTARTPARSSTTWAIATSSTPCATPIYPPTASRSSGRIKQTDLQSKKLSFLRPIADIPWRVRAHPLPPVGRVWISPEAARILEPCHIGQRLIRVSLCNLSPDPDTGIHLCLTWPGMPA